MNLVNELQASAESEDVLTVLRRARRLASKLGVSDIDDWLKAEQNGYQSGKAVPSYRMVKGSLCFNTNGPVPVGWGMIGRGIMDYPGGFVVDRAMADSLGEVMALIESVQGTKNGLYMQIEDSSVLRQLRANMNEYLAGQATFLLKMNTAQVRAIPEAVKDKVLDWACELERRGVHGENMTFNERERQLAHSVTFNISDSNIGQLSNSGSNVKRA